MLAVSQAVEQLRRSDPTLTQIGLTGNKQSDSQLAELVDLLLARPDAIQHVFVSGNQLTDETGVKLARFVAASSTINSFMLADNRFSEATYLAIAAALRVNSSLRSLDLYFNQAVDQTRIDAAFIEALRLNPKRPAQSMWQLFSFGYMDVDFERLKSAADRLGHPSLQLLLTLHCCHPLESRSRT